MHMRVRSQSLLSMSGAVEFAPCRMRDSGSLPLFAALLTHSQHRMPVTQLEMLALQNYFQSSRYTQYAMDLQTVCRNLTQLQVETRYRTMRLMYLIVLNEFLDLLTA